MLLLFVAFLALKSGALAQDLSLIEDIKTLSELPLEKLLHIKKSFEIDDGNATEPKFDDSDESPQALALQSKKNPKERGGYYHGYHYEDDYSNKKSNKKNIQSIFQISITTLAFLAFGGYLICLIVQAIKGKSNYYNYNTAATQAMAAFIDSSIKRRTTRRPPPRRKPYNLRKRRPKREVFTEADDERMYYTLIDLSEGYTKYHTENYLNYNCSLTYLNDDAF